MENSSTQSPDNIDAEKKGDLEMHAVSVFGNPHEVQFFVFDKEQKRRVYYAKLLYKPGETEPCEVNFKREDWIPDFVTSEGLLRWAQAYAERVLPGG